MTVRKRCPGVFGLSYRNVALDRAWEFYWAAPSATEVDGKDASLIVRNVIYIAFSDSIKNHSEATRKFRLTLFLNFNTDFAVAKVNLGGKRYRKLFDAKKQQCERFFLKMGLTEKVTDVFLPRHWTGKFSELDIVVSERNKLKWKDMLTLLRRFYYYISRTLQYI